MADDQAQSGGSGANGGVSSATVDAFIAAPEETQRNALTRMSAPAKAALLGALKTRQAAGTLKPAAASQPTTSPTPTTPTSSDSLVTPGLGQYQMVGADKKPRPVSYDQVETARNQGYRFADQKTLEQFGRDFAADPANKGKIQPWLEDHPVVGALPRVFLGAGGSLLEGLAGADRLISKISGERTIEPLQLEAAKSGTIGGVPEFLGATGEQIAELLVGEGEARAALKGTDLADRAARLTARTKQLTTFLDKFPRVKALVGLGTKVALEGSKAATEQGAQELVRSGGNIEQTKEAAKQAGVVGATIPIAAGLVKGGGKLLSESIQQRFDIDPFSVGKRLKKFDEDFAAAHKENQTKIKAARAAGDEATATRLEHDNVVLKQKALENKQQVLSDALDRARQAVYQRLQNIKSAARAYFGQAYGDIEKAGGGKQVQLRDLSNDMHEVKKLVSGSDESTKTFNDIAKRVQGLEDVEDLEGFSEADRQNLAPDELKQLDAEIANKKKMGIGPGVSLKNLNGYYSELGRVAREGSGYPGDVRNAAKAMQKAIDKRIQETYGEGLFKRNQLVRSQYRTFAQHYLDSDSNLAKAVDAPDYYHGTQNTFLSDDARQKAVSGKVKTQLIGDAKDPATQYLPKEISEGYVRDPKTGEMIGSGETTPSWRYRRQTHQLIEHMRNLEEGLNKTTAAVSKGEKTVATSAEDLAKARASARETERTAAKRSPLPTMTPEQLRQFKVDTLTAAAHNLGRFGTWVAIGGIVGGAVGFLNGIRTGKGVEGAIGEGGEGLMMGMVTPHIVSKILTQPSVVNSLTRLSKSDLNKLMALPPRQRGSTEQLIKMLADEAVREGKLKSGQIPWLRVLAGTVTRKQTEAGKQEEYQEQPVTMQDLEQLNDQLGSPTDQTSQQQGAPQ